MKYTKKRMEQENKNIGNMKKKLKVKDIKIKKKTSQNKDSNKKKILKNVDTHEIKTENEDNTNEMETSQNKDIKMEKKLKSKDSDDSDNSLEKEYCSEVTYLARKMASAEKLTQLDTIKLYNLRVQLRHTVLPQHEIETRAGSHMPTQKEIEMFEKIIPLKKGSYSNDEDKIIVGNWNAFCKLHNWNVKQVLPFLQLRIGNTTYMRNTTERRKFVQFLADGLPNRTLYSVYHRFRNLYVNNVQRRYKPEEDQMILDHLENNPSLDERCKYADLAKVLRRTRNSIWRRYRILKRKQKKRKNSVSSI